jgi:hypothetical protein
VCSNEQGVTFIYTSSSHLAGADFSSWKFYFHFIIFLRVGGTPSQHRFVPELKVNLLSVSTLEDMGYAVMFEDGQVLIRFRGSNLGCNCEAWHQGGYDVQGAGIAGSGSKGILDQRLVSVVESSGRVTSSKTVSWYDLTLMDEQSRISDQSATEVAGGSSSSEGAC